MNVSCLRGLCIDSADKQFILTCVEKFVHQYAYAFRQKSDVYITISNKYFVPYIRHISNGKPGDRICNNHRAMQRYAPKIGTVYVQQFINTPKKVCGQIKADGERGCCFFCISILGIVVLNAGCT